MQDVQAGDSDAFGLLYDRLAPTALLIARSLVDGEVGRVHDAMQDGFFSVWRSRALYRPELGSVESWAFTVMRHRALDATRRHVRHDRHRDQLDKNVKDIRSSERSVHAQVLAAENAAELQTMLSALPVAQRQVITMAYFDHLTHTEIAERLGLPLGTIKGRMRLGLNKLRGSASQTQATSVQRPRMSSTVAGLTSQ